MIDVERVPKYQMCKSSPPHVTCAKRFLSIMSDIRDNRTLTIRIENAVSQNRLEDGFLSQTYSTYEYDRYCHLLSMCGTFFVPIEVCC